MAESCFKFDVQVLVGPSLIIYGNKYFMSIFPGKRKIKIKLCTVYTLMMRQSGQGLN
jgi:hypothetical protein